MQQRFHDTLVEDYNVRKPQRRARMLQCSPYRDRRFADRLELRSLRKARIVIGRGGENIEKRLPIEKMIGKFANINIVEVKAPDIDAQLVAETLLHSLRTEYRSDGMKQAIGRA